jgi:hypothetical protein
MQNKTIRFSLLFSLALAALGFAACSKDKREDISDKTKEVYQDTKAAVVEGWADLKDYTFEKRSNFSAKLKVHQTEYEADVSKLRAEYSDATASASRRAAMNELKDSEADYKAKLDAVGNATADTWASARDNVIASWDRLHASYAKARAGN